MSSILVKVAGSIWEQPPSLYMELLATGQLCRVDRVTAAPDLAHSPE